MLDGALLTWLGSPHPERGLRTLEDDRWTLTTYAELARRALELSAAMRSDGIAAGDVIALADEEPVAFASGLFGVLHAGATAVVLPPERADDRVVAAGARAVLATTSEAATIRPAPHPRRLEGAPAIVQFTSGTTADPRPVHISRENLAANVAAIRSWLEWGPGDAGALWLPFHHDMGLVGLLTALTTQSDVWQLTPRQFLAAPGRWLECLGRGGATMTAAPTFGYAYAARRATDAQLADLDFSGWRHAIVGAERIDPIALGAFAARLAPHGFRASTLRPAYGMAEATLAVTGVPAGVRARAARPTGPLRFGAAVDAETVDAWTARDPTVIVSCGVPLRGAHVTVRDDRGGELPAGALGEIHVRGASVAAASTDGSGAFASGDAGFLHDGELFVVGRMASSVKVRGRHLACETLEAASDALLERPGCVVVPGSPGAPPAVVVVLEVDPGADARAAVEQAVRRHVGPAVAVTSRVHPIPRTSSGKPRRTALWRELLAQEPADSSA